MFFRLLCMLRVFHKNVGGRFRLVLGLPGSSAGKESTCSVGDLGLISRLRSSPGGRHGNPLKYSYLENTMDRGAWQATVHEVAQSDPTERLSTEQHRDLFYNISFQTGRTAEILRWAK